MYNLGDQFKISYKKNKSRENTVFKGKKYRITVLSERLVRLEYSYDGTFEDRPTELALNRFFDEPKFQVKEDEKYLEIVTSYFTLYYTKERSFKGSIFDKGSNLRVTLKDSDKYWYFNHPEVRRYNTPHTIIYNKKFKNKTLTFKGLYSIDGFASIDDSKSKVFTETGTIVTRENKNIDMYLFVYGKDYYLALKDYFTLSGYPALIPRYALGNWWSRNNTYSENELLDLIDSFNDNEIPVSIMLLDKDWHLRTFKGDEHLKTGFTWNKDLFPNPKDIIDKLHSHHIRLGLSINPTEGIYDIEDQYENMRKYLEADSDGVIPFNVLDPKFIDVYLKFLIHPLDNLGVDFYWYDHSPEKDLDKVWILKHYQFYDMKRDYKRRPMVLAYDGAVAPHRYPVLYSGKTVVGWDALKEMPSYNLSAANSGVSWWSHDIGGYFKGIEDNDLYTRFVQLGTFSPILKFGSDAGKYYKREPWRWSIKTYTIVKDYLELRHKLVPYIYNEAYKYSKNGLPFIKPLYYDYPEMFDDKLFKDEYYFGSEMFIAPIVKQKNYVMNRTVLKFFMPRGIWYDFKTGKKFVGDKQYTLFYKDQDYPVFAKIGSIIPLGYNEDMNDVAPPKTMEIHIFPGQSNIYKIYEDDGITDMYLKGEYLISSIQYNFDVDNYTVIIKALEGKSGSIPDKRNYKIRFRNTAFMDNVTAYFNNNKLNYKTYEDDLDFVIEVEDVPTIGQLTINAKGKDVMIEGYRVLEDDIVGIISDLQIETMLKEKVDAIIFGNLPINKKRVEIRKLKKKGLEKKYIKIFLKLLEYISEV